MAKGKKTVFFCQNCGHEENKWLGQCPACKQWNTFVEEEVVTGSSKQARSAGKADRNVRAVTLAQIEKEHEERYSSHIAELDRVLGGGIVPGSLVLVGGDPGIGKSTLLLQLYLRRGVSAADQNACAKDRAVQRSSQAHVRDQSGYGPRGN